MPLGTGALGTVILNGEESYVLPDVWVTITPIDPTDGATGVLDSIGATFKVEAFGPTEVIDLATVIVRVDGAIIFDGSNFSSGWSGSYYVFDGQIQGYYFVVIPDEPWTRGAVITFHVDAADNYGPPAHTGVAEWTFEIEGEVFYGSIYPMIFEGVRKADEQGRGLLLPLTEGPDEFWKTLMFDRTSDLVTLFEPENVDEKWLPWLKAQVGFTRDMDFQCSETELRRVIGRGMQFWRDHPAEMSYDDAVRMATGNRYRITNFFDHRLQADHTYLTEDGYDYDSHVLEHEVPAVTGNQFYTQDDPTLMSIFFVADVPLLGNVFTSATQYRWLQVLNHETCPELIGTYEIELLWPGYACGRIKGEFPVQSAELAPYRLLADSGENVTDIRLVDDGTVNRELLRFLLDCARASSERIDIVYLSFLDQFLTPYDLDQWATSGTVEVPSPGGVAELAKNAIIYAAGDWGPQTTAWQLMSEDVAGHAELRFYMQSISNNYYYLVADYVGRTLQLWKRVSGSNTAISVPVDVPYHSMRAGIYDLLRADVCVGATGNRIRGYVDGEMLIDEVDTASAFTSGGVGLAAHLAAFKCSMIEVLEVPATTDRVGLVT